jgi:hypothetical protein
VLWQGWAALDPRPPNAREGLTFPQL